MSKRLIRHPFIQALLARLIGLYLRLIWYTTRWSLVGAEHIDMKSGGPVILAFWHECLPLAAQGWRLMVQQAPEAAGRKAEALVWLTRLHPQLPPEEEGTELVLSRIRDLERELGVPVMQTYRPAASVPSGRSAGESRQ